MLQPNAIATVESHAINILQRINPQMIHPQIIEIMRAGVQQRTDLYVDLMRFVEGAIPPPVWGGGVHTNAIEQVILQWVDTRAKIIHQKLLENQQMQQPGYGGYGGYQQQPQPMLGSGYGGGGVVYSDASTSTSSTNYGTLLTGQPMAQTVVSDQPKPTVENFPRGQKMTAADNSTFKALLETSARCTAYYAGEVKLGGDPIRLSTFKFTFDRVENSPQDSYEMLRRILSADYTRGMFAHCVSTRVMGHIGISTDQFLEICSVLKDDVKLGWASALNKLKDHCKTAPFQHLEKFLIERFNHIASSRLRVNRSAKAKLSNLDQIVELKNEPPPKFLAGANQNFQTAVDNITDQLFASVFDEKKVIRADDHHFGDFVHCKDVSYYKDGFTQYDYGVFTEAVADRSKMINALMAENTVLRFSTNYIATNCIPDTTIGEVIHSPYGHYIGVLEGSFLDSLLGPVSMNEMDAISTLLCVERDSPIIVPFHIGPDLDDHYAIYRIKK